MKLIDADAIKYPEYFNDDEAHPDPFIEGFRQGKIDAICEVKALAPTIDAVEVVRCKDCKFGEAWKNQYSGFEGFKCKLFCADIDPDDFCSYGERRDADAETD